MSRGTLNIAPTQKNLTVVQGSTITVGVSVGLTSGHSSRVILFVQEVPAGTSVSFSPSTGKPPFSALIIIETSNVTPLGKHSLTVNARMGDLEASTTLFVLVIPLLHDIAVVSAEAPARAMVGNLVRVNATVENFGSVSETFKLELRVNQTLVDELFPITLISLANCTTTLHWNTTGFTPGRYLLVVAVPPVLGEVDLGNNSFRSGLLILEPIPSTPTPPSSPSPSPSGVSSASQNYGRELAIMAAFIESVLVFLVFLRGRTSRIIRRRK